MGSTFAAKPQTLLRETGNIFGVALEGFTWDVKQWWKEYLEQCWFIAKVTSVPVVLISIPFGLGIALHVGSFSRQLGPELCHRDLRPPVQRRLRSVEGSGSAGQVAVERTVKNVYLGAVGGHTASALVDVELVTSGASRVTRAGYYFTLSLLNVGGAWRVDDVVTLAYNPSTTGSGVTPPSASAPATTAPAGPSQAPPTSGP